MRVLLVAMLVAAGSLNPPSAIGAATKGQTAPGPPDSGVWTTVPIVASPLSPPRKAPADEYFGPQRLSNLGIPEIVRDMELEGTSPLALPQQLERIAAIEAAFGELMTKYPNDDWLPGEMNDFAAFLDSKRVPFAENLASSLQLYVQVRWPRSAAGKAASAILAVYRATPPFDMADLPAPQLHTNVGDYVFPKLRR